MAVLLPCRNDTYNRLWQELRLFLEASKREKDPNAHPGIYDFHPHK